MNGFSTEEDSHDGPPAPPFYGQSCCLIEDGERCGRSAGNASFSKRIQKSISQKKLKLDIDKSVSAPSCVFDMWSRVHALSLFCGALQKFGLCSCQLKWVSRCVTNQQVWFEIQASSMFSLLPIVAKRCQRAQVSAYSQPWCRKQKQQLCAAASAVDPKMAVANRVAKHGETEPPPATRSRGSSLQITCIQLCALELQRFPLLHKRLIVLAISHHKKSESFPNNDKAGR